MGLFSNAKEESTFSTASGLDNLHYVVLQVNFERKIYRNWFRKLD